LRQVDIILFIGFTAFSSMELGYFGLTIRLDTQP
jgi:hypothetical protein